MNYDVTCYNDAIMTFFIRMAAMAMAVAVVLGAMAAHALKDSLTIAQLETLDTAVLYLFIHALAILILALCDDVCDFRLPLRWILGVMTVGMVLFSGSLCAFVLGGISWMVYVTPFGGATFIVAWGLLAVSVQSK